MSTTITTNRLDADVLIVGAGPTGLALGTMLMRSGIAPVIVDKLATGQNTSRAVVVHAHRWKCWSNWACPSGWRTRA